MKKLIFAALFVGFQVMAQTDPCNEPNLPSRIEGSPNYAYFKGLLEKGDQADLSDFLRLWNPDQGDGSKLESAYFDCEDSDMGPFRTPPATSEVPQECHPDTLYSWGSKDKARLFNHLPDGEQWIGKATTYKGAISDGAVFCSISAVSTFGFGDVLIRYKIKPKTPYYFQAMGAKPNSVGVRTYDTWHDFTIVDTNILESVSMGTPEIYDEVVRDILRFQSNKRVSVYTWSGGAGIERLYHQQVDGHDQSESHLKKNLLELLREILNGEGIITYSKGSCRNRARAYSTTFPSYIQPRSTDRSPDI